MKILRSLYLVCLNVFISISLIFSPFVYSTESSNSSEGGGANSGNGGSSGGGSPGVILPDSSMGKVTNNTGPAKEGGSTHSVDFTQPGNSGKGQGGGYNKGSSGNSGGRSGRPFNGDMIGLRSSSGGDDTMARRAREREIAREIARERERERKRKERREAAFKAQVQKKIKEFQNIVKEASSTADGNKRKKSNEQILRTIERTEYRIQVQNNITTATAEIQQIMDSSSLNLDEKIKTAEDALQNIESRIRHIAAEPDMDMSYPVETKKAITKKEIRKMIQNVEEKVYENILDQAKKDLESAKTNLEESIQSLNQDIKGSLENPSDIEEIQIAEDFSMDEPPVYEILKTRYDRSELEALQEEEFTRPEEDLYEFLSPEGDFLDKNRAVYEKLRESNPYHEQGILAREIGLSAVETADEEFANGNEPEAEMAFQTAEVMSDIALGILPYIGAGKDAYELVTGKHLLSGRNLSLFERAMSGVGLVLASLSGGTLSSGAVRLSLQKTSKIMGKINSKLSKKFLTKLTPDQLEQVTEYQEIFFQSVNAIGIKTKTGAKSALKFVKQAFFRETPPADEVMRVVHSVGKKGVGNYARALDDLSHQLKNENLHLPELGEVFLARQLRFNQEISVQTKKIVNPNNLIQMGKIYAQKYNAFAEGVTESVFKGRVWRGGSKSYFSNKKQLFEFHEGMNSNIARYTVGEKALYTSLKEDTVIKEIVSKTKLSTPEEVRQAYLIAQSKYVEINKVLDLTNPKVLEQLDILDSDVITNSIRGNPNAYNITQVIGHIAKARGFKGILAPSAHGGKNFISFKELK